MFGYSRVLLVDALAVLFGLGAWLGVNGMYTQLPILIAVAPESWQLASYIVVVIQVKECMARTRGERLPKTGIFFLQCAFSLLQAANVGCVAYALAARRWQSASLQSAFIYAVLTLGCASLVLMAFFYQ